MFQREWRSQRSSGELRRIAITDDSPQEQYLYPEFVIARQMLQKHDFEVEIVDGTGFRRDRGQLLANDRPVDLIYNRMTDFALEEHSHEPIRRAYEAARSEERSVGKECVNKCQSRWSPSHKKKQQYTIRQ